MPTDEATPPTTGTAHGQVYRLDSAITRPTYLDQEPPPAVARYAVYVDTDRASSGSTKVGWVVLRSDGRRWGAVALPALPWHVAQRLDPYKTAHDAAAFLVGVAAARGLL